MSHLIHLVFYVKGFPSRETGGPAQVAFHLVREFLTSRNVRVTLLVQTDAREQEIRSAFATSENLAVVPLMYFPSPRELPTLIRAWRAIRKADVVQFNEFPFRHLALVTLAKLQQVPIVFSLHGLLSAEAENIFGPAYPLVIVLPHGQLRLRFPRLAIRMLLATYRLVAPLWDVSIAPSEALRKQAIDREKFEPSLVRVIPHGVDLPGEKPSLPSKHLGPIRLLYVGKLERIKGPDLLLAALEDPALRDVMVELAIVGTGSLEQELRREAERVRPHRVIFHGLRQGPDLEELYQWSDAVVVPSRNESFSLVILEAMATGRPILATAVGGVPEIVTSQRNAILVDATPRALAEGILRLAQDFQLRLEMAGANLDDVTRYSWPRAAARYLNLYEGLVHRTTRETPP